MKTGVLIIEMLNPITGTRINIKIPQIAKLPIESFSFFRYNKITVKILINNNTPKMEMIGDSLP